MRALVIIGILLCLTYIYIEIHDYYTILKFKPKKFLSLRKVKIVYLEYDKNKKCFQIIDEYKKILFCGSYRQCLKYLKDDKYEEE